VPEFLGIFGGILVLQKNKIKMGIQDVREKLQNAAKNLLVPYC
jgi:hypothetical protein